MSNFAINKALSLRLKDYGKPVQYENQPFKPTPGTTYLAEYFLPAETTPVGISFDSSRDFRGIYQISVCTPLDGLKKDGFEIADYLVETQFARDVFLDAAGNKVAKGAGDIVHCERTEQFQALPDGDRWVIPVRVRYRSLIRVTP